MKSYSYLLLLLTVSTLYYALEVLWTLFTAGSLTLGPLAFLLGWGLLVGWVLLVERPLAFLESRGLQDGAYYLFFAASVMIVVVKFRLVLGGRSLLAPPVLTFVVPFVLAGLWPLVGRRRPDSRWAGLVLVVTGLVSTDVLQWFWERTSQGYARDGVMCAVGGLVLLMVLVGGSRLVSPLRRVVEHRFRTALALVLLPVVVGGVSVAVLGRQPLIENPWPGGSSSPSSPERTVLPEGRSVNDLPNIILISLDTLRRDMVPPRAGERHGLRLPALRELWKDSIDFTRAYSTTGWTLPSHASLFTGQLPVQHGAVKTDTGTIDPESTTFPSYFHQLGYHTAGFTDDGAISYQFGFDRGFDVFWEQKSPNVDVNAIIRPMPPLKMHFLPGPVELAVAVSLALPAEVGSLRRPLENRPDFDRIARRSGWRLPFGNRPFFELPRRFKVRTFDRNLNQAPRWLHSMGESPRPFFLFLHTYQIHDYSWYERKGNLLYPGDLDYLEQFYPAPLMAYPGVLEEKPSLHPSPPPAVDAVWQRFERLDIPGLSPDHRRRFRDRLEDLSVKDREAFRDHLRLWNRRGDEVFELMVERLQLWVLSRSSAVWKRFLNKSIQRKRAAIGPAEHLLRRRAMPSLQRRLVNYFFYRHRVESVDERLGRFLDQLRDEGFYEDSIIIFVSDHGEGFEITDDTEGHCCGQLSEVLLKVPIWMKLPEEQSAGTTVQQRIQIQDVFPMALDHLGIRRQGDPWMAQSRASAKVPFRLPERDVLLGSTTVGFHSGGRHYRRFAHSGSYKATVHTRKPGYRFWRVGPRHLHQFRVPRAEVPPGQREKLLEALRRHGERFEASNPYLRKGGDVSGRLRKNLEGLGYM